MKNRNWNVKKKISDSKISNVWYLYYSILEDSVKSCNEMGYDIFCTNQILINHTKDFEDSQNRIKKFLPELKIINQQYITVVNGQNNVEMFTIQNL